MFSWRFFSDGINDVWRSREALNCSVLTEWSQPIAGLCGLCLVSIAWTEFSVFANNVITKASSRNDTRDRRAKSKQTSNQVQNQRRAAESRPKPSRPQAAAAKIALFASYSESLLVFA